MYWSATIDEDEVASGFSSSLSIEWMPAVGATYVCDTHNNRILSVQSDNKAYVWAGNGPGYSDGRQDQARFSSPLGVGVERGGAVIVSDTGNHCIRRIWGGLVRTFAGVPRRQGDRDGLGTDALFSSPMGVACDPIDLSIFISDSGNSKIKRITPEGVVTSFAGWGIAGYRDGAGLKAAFSHPSGLVWWRKKLLVCDTMNHCIRVIDLQTSVVGTLAGTCEPGYCDELGVR